MIQLVLLELRQEGKKHTFHLLTNLYVKHVNSRPGIIVGDPHDKYKALGFVSKPTVGDMLHLTLSCNGNGSRSSIFKVDHYCGQRDVLEDELLPSKSKFKNGKALISCDSAHHCIISEVKEWDRYPRNIVPLEATCLMHDAV